jgi:uncharacterized membrane protein YfcA
MDIKILYTIFVGIISGILGGAFGLSGSLIILPLLIILKIVPNYPTAVGTTLFSLLPPVSLLAFLQFSKKKQVDYVTGTILAITYFFAAYFGSIITGEYDDKTLKYIFATFSLIISIYFYYYAYTNQ